MILVIVTIAGMIIVTIDVAKPCVVMENLTTER